MMIIENKIEIGQLVFLKTDREQNERLVTAIMVSPIGITYRLSFATVETWHYEMEITEEKNVLV